MRSVAQAVVSSLPWPRKLPNLFLRASQVAQACGSGCGIGEVGRCLGTCRPRRQPRRAMDRISRWAACVSAFPVFQGRVRATQGLRFGLAGFPVASVASRQKRSGLQVPTVKGEERKKNFRLPWEKIFFSRPLTEGTQTAPWRDDAAGRGKASQAAAFQWLAFSEQGSRAKKKLKSQ